MSYNMQRIPISVQQSMTHDQASLQQQQNFIQPKIMPIDNQNDLRNTLQNLQNDYQRLAQAYSKCVSDKEQISRQILDRDRDILDFQRQMMDYQNNQENRQILEIESKRLQDIIQLQKKQVSNFRDIEVLKMKNTQIDELVKERKKFQEQGIRLAQLIEVKDREINELRQRNTQYEMKHAELRNQLHRINDMENINSELTQDIEQLNNALRAKHLENDSFKQKVSKLETSIQEARFQDQKIREYESRISLLASEVKRLTEICKSNQNVQTRMDPNLIQEFQALQLKNKQLQENEYDYQNKIGQMNHEQQVYEEKIAQLQRENEYLQAVNNGIQDPELRFQLEDKNVKIIRMKGEIERLSQQLQQK